MKRLAFLTGVGLAATLVAGPTVTVDSVVQDPVSRTVTVTYTPGTVGTYDATMSIASNDEDSPTEVGLTGTVPTITVKEGTTTLASGSSTVGFGDRPVWAGAVTKTITVETPLSRLPHFVRQR